MSDCVGNRAVKSAVPHDCKSGPISGSSGGAAATATTLQRTGRETVDVDNLIDGCIPLRPLQKRTYALCALVALLDGMDSQAIGVAGSLLADRLHVGTSALGTVFAAGQAGYMIGALLIGLLADRFGRRPMLILSVLLFGMLTVATAFAPTLGTLALIRLIAGIGLGGATPCFITLASEYLPERFRRVMVTALFAAYPIGGMLGGFLGSYMVTRFGLNVLFYLVGGLPLALVIGMFAMLPESLQFMSTRGISAGAAPVVAHLRGNAVRGEVDLRANSTKADTGSLFLLFRDDWTMQTLTLWAIFFATYGVLSTIFLWYPSLLHLAGVRPSTAAWMVGLENLGGVAGMLVAGVLMMRFGSVRVLLVAFASAAVCMAGFAAAGGAIFPAAFSMLLTGFLLDLAASAIMALCATLYPVVARSTAVGWAMGAGRLGQICASLFVGGLVHKQWGFSTIAYVLTMIPVVAGALTVQLSAVRRTRL
ncbi:MULTISPECIES: MFS transporter [Paraburkholderia]|uniref:MFS transporter n=1 Tax=Paraburkholderia TaxID=1822464 RepID=UPI00224D1B6C|nr:MULTISPECIES: MFS transporter [Paraburkholderia]MCX4163203.1 MFS transporter [Paraburkholderia megapolitana]MDN7158699.1 MFS transporter [Paraburkholderia sp. CHISQ3]MDQ6495746.1 MFS transporter [Paraburkholderia megapolitana]